jgi:hypothetical protein
MRSVTTVEDRDEELVRVPTVEGGALVLRQRGQLVVLQVLDAGGQISTELELDNAGAAALYAALEPGPAPTT